MAETGQVGCTVVVEEKIEIGYGAVMYATDLTKDNVTDASSLDG